VESTVSPVALALPWPLARKRDAEAKTNMTDLSSAIDVYSEWVDAAGRTWDPVFLGWRTWTDLLPQMPLPPRPARPRRKPAPAANQSTGEPGSRARGSMRRMKAATRGMTSWPMTMITNDGRSGILICTGTLGWVGYRTWDRWWFAGDTSYTTDGRASWKLLHQAGYVMLRSFLCGRYQVVGKPGFTGYSTYRRNRQGRV
jgi:hypothetical protein